MTFKDCKNARSCGRTLCVPEFCHEFERMQQTNADRIRAMSDEELTTFLNKIVICHQLRREGYCERCPLHEAKPCDTEGIIDWLKQPAE